MPNWSRCLFCSWDPHFSWLKNMAASCKVFYPAHYRIPRHVAISCQLFLPQVFVNLTAQLGHRCFLDFGVRISIKPLLAAGLLLLQPIITIFTTSLQEFNVLSFVERQWFSKCEFLPKSILLWCGSLGELLNETIKVNMIHLVQ